jgi:phytoene dehydrogenase-like protein
MAGVTGKYGVVIIGSGFGGIGMGIALGKAGTKDFVILEKNSDLGGTWRDNLYPGCACDVPSPLYSFSYELNPAWTRLFAPQPEIWDYLRSCSAKYGIDEHIRYGVRVDAMEWDDAEWRLLRCPCEYGSTRKNARDTTAATASHPTCSNWTTWACRPRPGPVRCPLPWRPLPGGRRLTARSTR